MTTDDMVLTPSEGASGAWADLTPGIYPAVLTDISDEGASTVYPDAGPRYKLTFTLEGRADDAGEPVVLYRWVSQKITLGSMTSKLAEFAVALGVPPTAGVPYRVSQLLGRRCRLFVNLKETPNGTRPQIADVLAPEAARTVAAGKTAQPDPLASQDEGVGACFICDAPASAYDGRGREVCEAHKTVH